MNTIREVSVRDLRFMVNPTVVSNGGRIKKWRGRPVHLSACHIDRNGTASMTPHPGAFEFVVTS